MKGTQSMSRAKAPEQTDEETQVQVEDGQPTPGELAEKAAQGQPLSEAELNMRVHVMFSAPLGWKLALDQFATQNNTTAAALIRKHVSEVIGIAEPDMAGPQRKYGSAEERKAAQKERNNERRKLVAALLKAYKDSGGVLPGLDIDEDDEDDDE